MLVHPRYLNCQTSSIWTMTHMNPRHPHVLKKNCSRYLQRLPICIHTFALATCFRGQYTYTHIHETHTTPQYDPQGACWLTSWSTNMGFVPHCPYWWTQTGCNVTFWFPVPRETQLIPQNYFNTFSKCSHRNCSIGHASCGTQCKLHRHNYVCVHAWHDFTRWLRKHFHSFKLNVLEGWSQPHTWCADFNLPPLHNIPENTPFQRP